MTKENRILLVEDETKLLDHLCQTLQDEGFQTSSLNSFNELENFLTPPAKSFDLLILDRLLQSRDSAQLLPKIKQSFPAAKIMILSAINNSSEKASLLDMGADDYVAKPFASDELIARVRALLRRDNPDLKFGNVILNSLTRTLNVDGKEIQLTNREFTLLRTLLQTPGKIFSKAYFYEQVWEMSPDVESNVVESTMNKLRRRLTDAGATVHIKNARNVGYWIEE